MKKFLLTIAVLFASLPVLAQLSGDGYYRVQNYMSKRYVYITDDKGKLNYATTSADMYAIQLWKDFEKASCDPATVCYIKNVDGVKYDIQAQGTGIYNIVEAYVRLRASNGVYYAYASKEGITKYLGDGEQADTERGVMSDGTSGDWRKWYIVPINLNDGQYFGVKPVMQNGGNYYTSYYTSFPYSFASSGMKAMYVAKIGYGMAVVKEISGVVPAATPVILQCSSDKPVNNKLNIGGTGTAVSGNMLKGVYFNNPMKTHYNRVAYDAKTMRMLGVMSDGSLGFVTSSIDFVPANNAYLSVPEGTPAELKIVTEQEYNDYVAKLPQSISLDNTSLSLTEGDNMVLKATILPATADQSVSWASSEPNVATVSNGNVAALKPGEAVITATTINGISASCKVVVNARKVLVQSVTLDHNTADVNTGDEFKLVATVLPVNADNKTLDWNSNAPAVASVDNAGNVKALSSGTAEITVSTTDGSNLSSKCVVNVSDPVILVSSIVLDKNSFEAVVGATVSLVATVFPENATNKNLLWTSSNDKLVGIDQSGNVTIKATGKAEVKVSATDGSGVSAVCSINGISGIEDILTDASSVDVYGINGILLLHNATLEDVKSLAPGVYVIGNRKVLIGK